MSQSVRSTSRRSVDFSHLRIGVGVDRKEEVSCGHSRELCAQNRSSVAGGYKQRCACEQSKHGRTHKRRDPGQTTAGHAPQALCCTDGLQALRKALRLRQG